MTSYTSHTRSHTRSHTAPRVTTLITPLIQTYNILQHSKAKTLFNNGCYTTNLPRTYTVTTTYIKTNMRHVHTSVVSMHLATRGNNKILCTPPPYISSSEDILLRLTHRTLAQLRTNKSPFLKSYLHKVYAKSHPSPPCPLCNNHIHNTHHLFNCTHIVTPEFVEWISAQVWHCIQRLATDAGLREGFELNVGLHQRSVMSPLLFSVVFDVVSIEARSGLLSELLYADDLVRMAPTMEQLGRSVAEWRVSLLDWKWM